MVCFANQISVQHCCSKRVTSLGLPVLAVLQTHGFKATVWDEIDPISRFFGSYRFVFARRHMDARW